MAKGPFMEFLRGEVDIDAITVTTTQILTPNSKTESLAMLIHQIELHLAQAEMDLGAENHLYGTLSTSSHEGDAAEPDFGDPECFFKVETGAVEGIVAGAFAKWQVGQRIKYFNPPLLYSKDAMYLEGRKNRAGAADTTLRMLVGYTLEKVSREDYIAALVD